MKTTVILALAMAAGQAAATTDEKLGTFYEWMLEHDKAYDEGDSFVKAFEAWKENDEKIANHPSDSSYTLGHNKYSDMTWEEFRGVMGLGQAMPREAKKLRGARSHTTFSCEGDCAKSNPTEWDWSTQGAVTPVKDQGQCGSCWSFSTTGSLEGAYFLAGNDLTSFSEQMLVDCDHNGDMGCNGGLMDNAFGWIESNGGLCAEEDYPYDAKTGTCQASSCSVVKGSTPSTYTDVQTHSVSSLEAAVAQQPVSIAIQADQSAFQLYKSGVMDGECGSQLDHGVLVVGYGTDADSGETFWKVKNSWGASWGEDGYIRLAKGGHPINGECGILDDPSFPTIPAAKKGPAAFPALAKKATAVKAINFAQEMAKARKPKKPSDRIEGGKFKHVSSKAALAARWRAKTEELQKREQ